MVLPSNSISEVNAAARKISGSKVQSLTLTSDEFSRSRIYYSFQLRNFCLFLNLTGIFLRKCPSVDLHLMLFVVNVTVDIESSTCPNHIQHSLPFLVNKYNIHLYTRKLLKNITLKIITKT